MVWLALMAMTAAPEAPAQNVVLIVTDGLRPREVFEGAERRLMGKAGGVEEEAGLVERYWRPTAAERRRALLPFVWGQVAAHGQLFGDAAHGCPAHVANGARVSYPGYNELLTGVVDPRIDSNAARPNPNTTVFEWLDRRVPERGQVQAFGTWETFFSIFNVERSHLDVRAGWNPPFERDAERTPGKDLIDTLHRTTTQLFGGNALDSITYAGLKESLKTQHPRILFLGLGETDEWMHAGRYDLALQAAHRADAIIGDLWDTLQAMPEYRGTTTFIITTDHGRGLGARDWRDHGREVDGSDQTWIALLGPGVPALGVRRDCSPVTQRQVASTLAALVGEDWRAATPEAAVGLPLAEPPLLVKAFSPE
jgi:Type I phosphodiesterase / nucleotide pyrophosphatase